MMQELHSDTPISKHQIEEYVPLERTYNASTYSTVDGSDKGLSATRSSASVFVIGTDDIASQR